MIRINVLEEGDGIRVDTEMHIEGYKQAVSEFGAVIDALYKAAPETFTDSLVGSKFTEKEVMNK